MLRSVRTLRHREVGEVTVAEQEHLRRLLALPAPAAPMRSARCRQPSPRGAAHPARTVRRALRDGGEATRLLHRRRRPRPRRVVLLTDVSGSMSPYADALPRFPHASVRAHPVATEVFTTGCPGADGAVAAARGRGVDQPAQGPARLRAAHRRRAVGAAVDHFVSGHSMTAFEELTGVIRHA